MSEMELTEFEKLVMEDALNTLIPEDGGYYPENFIKCFRTLMAQHQDAKKQAFIKKLEEMGVFAEENCNYVYNGAINDVIALAKEEL